MEMNRRRLNVEVLANILRLGEAGMAKMHLHTILDKLQP
jgi:hypothetical protein